MMDQELKNNENNEINENNLDDQVNSQISSSNSNNEFTGDCVKHNFAKKLLRLVLFFVIAIVIAIILIWLIPIRGYYIITDSMEPNIMVNDLAFVNIRIDKDELQINDIIAFETDINNDGKNDIVIHYIYDIIEDVDQERVYLTISEQADVPDEWEIKDKDILGKYICNLSRIGIIYRFFNSTLGRFVLILDIVIIIWLSSLLSKRKKPHECKNNV